MAVPEDMDDNSIDVNGHSFETCHAINHHIDNEMSVSYLALIPRGLEVDVMRSLRQQFQQQQQQQQQQQSKGTVFDCCEMKTTTMTTPPNPKVCVWNENLYNNQVELAKSRMYENESKNQRRQRQQQQHVQKEQRRDGGENSNQATDSPLEDWTPSPSSFPVGSVEISPGLHASIGYFSCSTNDNGEGVGSIRCHQQNQLDRGGVDEDATGGSGVRYKSIVSTGGSLEGIAWIQIETATNNGDGDASPRDADRRRRPRQQPTLDVHKVLKNSRCIGPILALVSTQTDNCCLIGNNNNSSDSCRSEDKYFNHTLSEMISEIRRHLNDKTGNEGFRTRWQTAFSVWKKWVVEGDDDDEDEGERKIRQNLWRERLSDEDYHSLKDRIKTNQLRFRLSCMRQDPPPQPEAQHRQQQSQEHQLPLSTSTDMKVHGKVSNVRNQQPIQQKQQIKSSRRKGNRKEFMYERRDLVQGVMDDPICRQMLVPYYTVQSHNDSRSERNEFSSSSSPSHEGGWKVDLKKFDIELVMIILPGSPGRWTFGISLLPYQYCSAKAFEHNVIPTDISSPYYGGVLARIHDISTESLPSVPKSSAVFDTSIIRLRPTTAHILLCIADLQPGDVVFDPFVGIGTVALESERYRLIVTGLGGDLVLNDPSYTRSARDMGAHAYLAAWDASYLPIRSASVDVIVSDLPFGQKCLNTNMLTQLLPLVFWECARVLRPGGRMVLLCGSTPTSMISFIDAFSRRYWDRPFSRFSPVSIGGLVAWVICARRNRCLFHPSMEEENMYKSRVRKVISRREQTNRQRHSEFTQQNARQKRKRPTSPTSQPVLVPTRGPQPGPSPAPTPVSIMLVQPKQSQITAPNIVVMSEAGKPIFTRFPISEKFGLLVQAIRTSIKRNDSLELGEIQCLESNKKIICAMIVGSITLISISNRSVLDGSGNSFVYAKYRLEYVYTQLIMTMTDQVQIMFKHNPSLDLQSTLSSYHKVLRSMLDDLDSMDSTTKATPYMAAAVSPLFPFPYKMRHKVSKVLQSVAGRPENNTAFGLLVAGDKLISIVQPAYPQHQLKTSDLHLILHFVAKQPGLSSGELWIPICLPRFNSSGFLYAYAKCVDDLSNLTVIMLSSHGTTEQFQLLRESSLQLQKNLRIPLTADSVVTALSSSSSMKDNPKDDSAVSASASSRTSSDIDWKKGDESTSFDETIDEDYVNISNEMLVGNDTSLSMTMEDGELLYHSRQALEESTIEAICNHFLGDDRGLVIHFLFRLDVPIKDCSDQSRSNSSSDGRGFLSQFISVPARGTLDEESRDSRQQLWANYQKINLRLRLGSSTVESSMDAFDMINKSCTSTSPGHKNNGKKNEQEDDEPPFPSISKYCTAMGLVESPPCTVDSIAYIIEGGRIFLGMNGKNFELFLVINSEISVKRAAAIGTKLVRGIMAEEKKVFLSKPLTWRYY